MPCADGFVTIQSRGVLVFCNSGCEGESERDERDSDAMERLLDALWRGVLVTVEFPEGCSRVAP